MEREQHLEYCKLCLKQGFDLKKGIVCNLTNDIADFEKECPSFELDNSKLEIETKKKTKSQEKTSFGFSPKYSETFVVEGLSKKELLVLAIDSAKSLKWNVGFISEEGFVAYTNMSFSSWSEEIKIEIGVSQISIKSECAGSQMFDWGKNKKNIKSFISTFNKLKTKIDDIDFESKYEKLDFIDISSELSHNPLKNKERISGFFSLFKPTDSYFITPIIVDINILIFIIMVIFGVHPIVPNIDDLLLWGANFRPNIVDGEWWRLFSSTFLHAGIFHLLFNMYALVYIGLLLEPYLGKARMLSAYLVTGILGSLLSVYMHDNFVSIGASGAIFGLYGVFLSLLTTNIIEKAARKQLIISMGIFVAYNLLNGLNGGVDNAAHIGGLLSGFIIGYVFYPYLTSLKKKMKYASISFIVVIMLISTYLVVSNLDSDLLKYRKGMDTFAVYEKKALELYKLPDNVDDYEMLKEIREVGIPYWKKSIVLLDSLHKLELNDNLYWRIDKVSRYCNLRIEIYRNVAKSIEEGTDKYRVEITRDEDEIQQILSDLLIL